MAKGSKITARNIPGYIGSAIGVFGVPNWWGGLEKAFNGENPSDARMKIGSFIARYIEGQVIGGLVNLAMKKKFFARDLVILTLVLSLISIFTVTPKTKTETPVG